MKTSLAVLRTTQHRCPGCPGDRDGVFETMIGEGRGSCAFLSATLEPRSQLPDRFFGEGATAIVRRGLIMRTRTDGAGRVQGIDLAGPGHLIPLDEDTTVGAMPGGYAISRAHLCLASSGAVDRAVDARDEAHARDIHDLLRLQRRALQRMERYSEARARPGLDARLAGMLGVIVDELGPTDTIPEDIQQRDLAVLLGVRHESVCRSLASLQKRGILARTPQGLRIHERSRLELC